LPPRRHRPELPRAKKQHGVKGWGTERGSAFKEANRERREEEKGKGSSVVQNKRVHTPTSGGKRKTLRGKGEGREP